MKIYIGPGHYPDVARALQDGQIAGAGLDVTDPEPLPDEPPPVVYEQRHHHPAHRQHHELHGPVAGAGGRRQLPSVGRRRDHAYRG